MTAKSKAGKFEWQARTGSYPQELTDQITTQASARMDAWIARGHIPPWIRAKAMVRGHAIALPTRDGRH